jgi:hypothetical protein
VDPVDVYVHRQAVTYPHTPAAYAERQPENTTLAPWVSKYYQRRRERASTASAAAGTQ